MERIELTSCEISLTDHCNLKCVACNHSSPLLNARITPLETIVRDLKAMAEAVFTSEVRLSGGEPLLHPEIVNVTKAIRDLNFTRKITLITNGILLHKLNDSLLECIDQVWISRYPGIKYTWNERDLRRRLKAFGVRLWIRDVSSFSTTFLNQRNDNGKIVRQIFRRCRIVHDWKCNFIYEGRLFKCTVAPFIADRLRPLGIDLHNKEHDSVSLLDNPNLRQNIESYLADRTPLTACEFCIGTVGKSMKHRQLGRNESELTWDTKDISGLVSVRKSMVSELMLFIGHFRDFHLFVRRVKWMVRFRHKRLW